MRLNFFKLFQIGVGHFPKSLKKIKKTKKVYLNDEKHPILYYRCAIW